jgi:leader peptidase (prepilin peptidase)/N-methyltransferase
MKLKALTLFVSTTYVISAYITIIITGYTSIYSLLTYILLIVIGMTLIYVAVEDIRSMEIPSLPIYSMLVILVLINVVLLVLGQNNIVLFKHFKINPLNNIFAGIVGACISGLIYMISNRKGLGDGDIYLFSIMGLMLGLERIVFGFYLTLVSSLIFASIQVLKHRRISDLRIPFVPFIVFGTLTAVILNESYSQLRAILFI